MEAVKKLQNATKLLQKVIDCVGNGESLGPLPELMCGFSGGFEGSAGGETMVPYLSSHICFRTT